MLISEMISKLEEIKNEHGDIECWTEDFGKIAKFYLRYNPAPCDSDEYTGCHPDQPNYPGEKAVRVYIA